ncbi:ABC transporter ATP-binding protein [Pseudomonadota bacterium]
MLEVRELVKRYGDLVAVDGVALTIPKGICFGLLGPNGAGKSTTIEIMEGISNPTEGQILYNGNKVDKSFKSIIGIQFQSTSLQDFLTVLETLKLFESLYASTVPLDEIIDICQLKDFIHQDTRKISGGQRQRLLLGVAMINDPEILFLDEPTTGLDPHSRRNFWNLIEAIKKKNKTIILTTHYMEEAYMLCDTIAIMDKGKVIAEGSPRELLAKHYNGAHVSLSKNVVLPKDFPWKTNRVFDRFEFHTEDVKSCLDYLLNHNVDMSSLEVKKQTLDDLFIEITGKNLRH